MQTTGLRISEMRQDDLPFLRELWHNVHVMRYADEFPRLRGWSRYDPPERAWETYQRRRQELGPMYTQQLLRLGERAIGESFLVPLPEGFNFGSWRKPAGVLAVIGDIKLLPDYWNCGLGTAGMRQVVQYAFNLTACDVFVVPPHQFNAPAIRVYEKAGFQHPPAVLPWRGHRIMELSRERFQRLYASGSALRRT